MNISVLSVRRGVTFTVVWLVVMLFGLFSLTRLKLDLLPDLQFPGILVVTTYTGASPEDMETLITRPIETTVASVERVKSIESSSEQGLSIVNASFEWGTDMDQAETDVRRALDLIDSVMPDDADAPLVFAFSTDMKPVMFLALDGPLPLDQLRTVAEDQVQPRLERVPAVASARVTGGLKREIHVDLDPMLVEATGLDVNAVVQALYAENLQEPGGTVDQEPLSFTIHTVGRYTSLDDIRQVVVGRRAQVDALGHTTGSQVIRVGEVATVSDTFEEATSVEQVDGQPAVRVDLRRQSGENTVQAIQGVFAALPAINADLPDGVRVRVMSEDSGRIKRSLSNLTNTGLVGVVIAFVVLLIFLGDLRAAVIVSTAIPLSVVATFAVMDQADMTLNILSMAGLALAIGMLVDNAVVVLENIFRLREQGRGAWLAAAAGARGVGTAVTASTLTTLSVFIPILFVEGFAGMMFRDMAVTICFALAVSLVVALSFVPLAASRFLARESRGGRAARARFDRLLGVYRHGLDWALGHRAAVIAVLGAAVVLAGLLATTLRTDLMSQQDRAEIYITVDTPVGSSLTETWTRVDDVVQRVKQVVAPEELQHTMVEAGAGTGIQAIFSGGANSGSIRAILVPPGERQRTQGEIEDAIRAATRDLAGVEVHVGSPFSLTGDADIEVALKGYDIEQARAAGLEMRKRIAALPEVAEVEFSLADQQPELEVVFDRPKMAELGLSSAAVGRAVATAFQGRMAGFYSDSGDEFDIRVRWEKSWRGDIDAVRRMPVATPAGRTVPLSSVASVDIGLGPVAIDREDQQRSNTLEVTLANTWTDEQGKTHRKDMRGAIERVRATANEVPLPAGFTLDVGGSAEDFADSFKSLGIALLISIVLVYLVMASQFESLRQPLVIIFSVPMALIGVTVTFAVTRTALDVASMIGVIMLVGIAVNNGIVMVDAANQLRREGLDRTQAIREASLVRLRPVLLTSLTTILAMVPLALQIGEGSEQWSGMARAVIGGLMAAAFLTLFLVPVLYTLFAPKRLRAEEIELDTGLEARREGSPDDV